MKNDSILPYSVVTSLQQISNIYEMRLFGWVIAKAQSVLKLYNRDLSDINLQHAMNLVRVTMPARYLLPPGDTNYNNITKAFSLAKKTIPFHWQDVEGETNIIAFPEYCKKHGQKHITFVLDNKMWLAMLDFSRGYRLVNLQVYMGLRSTYSVILYMLITQQTKPITYGIDKLKEITGANTRPAYARTYNFIRKVLEATKKELDRCSPWTYTYEAVKSGKAITSIVLYPQANQQYNAPTDKTAASISETVRGMRCRLDERVIDYLTYSYGMTASEVEVAERYLADRQTAEQQLAVLADIKTAALRSRARNMKGYLINALRQRI